jgi:outer membrane protein OmpA-like peptidoglycan-associated protein
MRNLTSACPHKAVFSYLSRHTRPTMRSLLRTTLPLLLVLAATATRAQENIGMANGNYAGIAGAWLNPASIVDSRYKFDLMIYGFDSYFTNDFMEVRNGTLVRRLLRREPYNGSFAAVKEDLLRPLQNAEGPVNAAATSQWQMPFSFMAGLGARSSIALNIRNRSGMFLDSLNRNTANMLFAELGDTALMGGPQQSNNLRYGFLNWMESGFTYGRVLVKGKHHFLKGAATAKLLAGNAGVHIASEQFNITFQDANTLSLQSPLIEYARTSDADFDTFSRRNLFNNVENYAFGWDAGLVYEFRSNVKKRRFMDMDQVEKERRDLNKYFLRVGVSLLDVGKFTFDRRPLTQNHTADIRDWDISDLNASDLDSFDEAYSELVDFVPNGSPTFTYRLPTALAANVDLRIFGGFYVNAATYRDATSFFSATDATLKAREWTAVTPRFENRWLGLYVPVSVSDGNTRIGATVRIGPLYLGSTNLADLLANEQNTSADFHAGLRFSIGHGKPSALKKKYEMMRKQQEAIGNNRSRLDSLEREVYGLKMVVQNRNERPTTIVNNFFGSDSASMALARDSVFLKSMAGGSDDKAEQLRAENEYLMNELVRRSIDQRADSAYIARLEQADERERELAKTERENQRSAQNNGRSSGTNDRASQRAMQQQASAQQDQARELERIRRQMRAQTAMMATTAGATVAIATQDKEPAAAPRPTGAAIYLNDSTVVLNGDTIPMVVPAGARSAAQPQPLVLTTPARFPITKDTIRIVETVRDTVIQVVRDTVTSVVRDTVLVTERLPEDALADVRPFTKNIYFATGSTSLGAGEKQQLRRLAAWLVEHPERTVEVTGVADASGSAAANDAVANRRAQSVKRFLVEQGVAAARIETNWRISPSPGAPDPNDRRAELQVR